VTRSSQYDGLRSNSFGSHTDTSIISLRLIWLHLTRQAERVYLKKQTPSREAEAEAERERLQENQEERDSFRHNVLPF
jgi:hypothetical protein